MTTPIRPNGRPRAAAVEPQPLPVEHPPPRPIAREPDVIDDPRPSVPAYLRRAPDAPTPPRTCVEASVISPEESQRNVDAARAEIQTLSGVPLDVLEQNLQRVAHEAASCSPNATVRVRLPDGQDCRVSTAQLATLQNAVREQRGWLRMVSDVRAANDRTIGPLAAAVQRAEQQRPNASSSLCVALPSGGHAQLSLADARVVHRLLDAQAIFLGQVDVHRQLAASRFRDEIYRGGVLTVPGLGTVVALGECLRHRSITGRSVTQLDCILAVAGASIELAVVGYQGARAVAAIARTEELAIATVNSGVRLEEVWRAVRQMTPEERELVRHLVNEMRANARTVPTAGRPPPTILRPSEITAAVELLRRRGITVNPNSPSVIEVGETVHQVGERGIAEAFPEPAGEPRWGAQETFWSNTRTDRNGTEVLEAGIGGTSDHGTITVSPRGTFNDRMRAVLHERVHQLLRLRLSELTGRTEELASLFNKMQTGHYDTSMVRRYVEEALAEANALARTDAENWLGAAAMFPLEGSYRIALREVGRGDIVTAAAAAVALGLTGVLADAAIDLGVCVVGGRRYRAELQRVRTPLEQREDRESRQQLQSQRQIDAIVRARTGGNRP